MGTGRTLRKESHVRPCKTPAGKARRSKAQRARLVKFGMDAETVGHMGAEEAPDAGEEARRQGQEGLIPGCVRCGRWR